MLRGPTLAKPVRRWGVIAAAGAIGFAIGIAGFARLGLDEIFRILSDLPAAAVGTGLSVTLALAGLAIASVFAVVRERKYGGAATLAIDNMTQGLSMFDGAAPLVLCNSRYIEIVMEPGIRRGARIPSICVGLLSGGERLHQSLISAASMRSPFVPSIKSTRRPQPAFR